MTSLIKIKKINFEFENLSECVCKFQIAHYKFQII